MVLVLKPSRRRDEISDEDTNGADERIAKPMDGINVNLNGRCVLPKKFLIYPKNKLVVPRGVVTSFGINPGGKFSGRVDPRGSVGFHFFGHRFQILGRNNVYFQ